MQRSTCWRMVPAVALVAACTGDPTGDLRGGVDHLVATPGALFLAPGASTNVTVEAVDEQGNRQGTSFTLRTVGAGIAVTRDSTFDPVYDAAGNLVLPERPTRVRYVVSPVATTGSSGFEVEAGGRTLSIPVRLVPDSLAGSFSAATPGPGDTVSFTTQAPFRFRPGATVDAGGSRAILISQSATTLSFVPLPGGAPGPLTVTGVALDYATTLALALPSVAPLAVPAGFPGTDDLATAPDFPVPATGAATLFVDAGAVSPIAVCQDDLGADCRAYSLTLATPRTFQLRATWEGTADLGLYFYDAGGGLLDSFCDAKGDGAGGQPESCTISLPAGSYNMVVASFSATAPAWIRVDVTGQ